jgi:DNA (cytosine-5)-methyltransferase 1
MDLGFEAVGANTVGLVEWDSWCNEILARHWPDTPRWGDVSDVKAVDLPPCDIISFGSPCQDLSISGQRAGMKEGTRSGLFLEAIRIIKEYRDLGRIPSYAVWENVGGALSSSQGDDFAQVLDLLAECGAVDIQWRVLDARFCGVPQRRRRVFVVACFDLGRVGGPQILPVTERVRRDPAKGSKSGTIASALTANGVGAGCGADDNSAQANHLIPDVAGTLGGGSGRRGWSPDTERMTFIPEMANTLTARDYKGIPTRLDKGMYTVVAEPMPFDTAQITSKTNRSHPKPGDPSPTLPADGHAPAVVSFNGNNLHDEQVSDKFTPTLRVANGAGVPQVAGDMIGVRRLTPRECERLQGWPDDHTRWDSSGNEIPDSARYKMIGNGIASPVARWLAYHILKHLELPYD